MTDYDRTTQDFGNIVSLDHVNLTVPDQQMSTLFHIVGMGHTRDPYMTVGLENMWVNIGREQFHLPTRDSAQVLRGRIGLVTPDVDGLEERLDSMAPRFEGTQFAVEREGHNLDVTCPWGNRIRCHPADGERLGGANLGLEYLILNVPAGTAPGIARFYGQVMGATADVVERRGAPTARVQAGWHQALLFREDPEETRTYDNHHIAVYIADFSGPHKALQEMDLITEESNASQYRFVNITDPETGETLYELEHEVRSMAHPMYARELVNRNPVQSLQVYRRGADALMVG